MKCRPQASGKASPKGPPGAASPASLGKRVLFRPQAKCPPQAPREAVGPSKHPPATCRGEYPRPNSSPCHEPVAVSWCPVSSDTQKKRPRVPSRPPVSSLHPSASDTASPRQAARQSGQRGQQLTCKGQRPRNTPFPPPPPHPSAAPGGSQRRQQQPEHNVAATPSRVAPGRPTPAQPPRPLPRASGNRAQR